MAKRIISLLLVAVLCMSVLTVQAAAASASAVLINEICSKNTGQNGNATNIVDSDGDYPDWIELYNPTATAVDLSGYGISDKQSEPFRALLPSGTTIAPGGYLVIFCSKALAAGDGYISAAIGISADGEKILLTSPDGERDLVELPALAADSSFGRYPDGGQDFRVQSPTPGRSNATSATVLPEPPSFSRQSGIYESSFSLTLSCSEPNGEIYYTTDGSEPSDSSTRVRYTAPIKITDRNGEPNVIAAIPPNTISTSTSTATPSDESVDKGRIIRACVVSQKGVCSQSATASYFIGPRATAYGDIPILSVTTDFDNLYDYDIGIFANGRIYDEFRAANPGVTQNWLVEMNSTQRGREWERACHVALIEPDGSVGISQNCGMRTMGGGSRATIQKSIRFYARADYGNSHFNYALFDNSLDEKGRIIDKYKTFAVRGGGNDGSYLKFTDNFIQSRVSDLSLETQNGRATLVFINGEFYGVQVLQEDYSEHYFANKYDIDPDEVIVVRKNQVDEGLSSDLALYREMTSFITGKKMADPQNYEAACAMLDMKSFADYMATEIFICNHDWPDNNTGLWRVRTPDAANPAADGRWRFLLYDTEYSMWMYFASTTRYDYNKLEAVAGMQTTQGTLATMLWSLLRNESFKQLFVESLTDIMNICFEPTDALLQFRQMYNYYLPYLESSAERFSNSDSGNFTERRQQIHTFLRYRKEYMLDMTNKFLRLKTQPAKLTLTLPEQTTGRVYCNDTAIDYARWEGRYSGDYFNCYPVRLTAEPMPGYDFVGWQGASDSTEASIELTLTADTELRAVFAKTPDIIYGDANADGAFNAKDILLLKQYLAAWSVELQHTATDVDLDGSCTAKDLLLMRRRLAGQNVVLGK